MPTNVLFSLICYVFLEGKDDPFSKSWVKWLLRNIQHFWNKDAKFADKIFHRATSENTFVKKKKKNLSIFTDLTVPALLPEETLLLPLPTYGCSWSSMSPSIPHSTSSFSLARHSAAQWWEDSWSPHRGSTPLQVTEFWSAVVTSALLNFPLTKGWDVRERLRDLLLHSSKLGHSM